MRTVLLECACGESLRIYSRDVQGLRDDAARVGWKWDGVFHAAMSRRGDGHPATCPACSGGVGLKEAAGSGRVVSQ